MWCLVITNIDSLGDMGLIRYFIIVLFLIFSSCKKNQYYCISKLKFERSYQAPAPDIISITIDKSFFENYKYDINEIREIFFIKEGDTIKHDHLKKRRIKENTIDLIFSTTRLIDETDTILINKGLKKEKVIIIFEDGKNAELNYCTK